MLEMSGFTYQKPDEQAYLNALVKFLAYKHEKELADLMQGAKCVISHSNTFSRKRWDAYWTTIYFYVPVSRLESITQEKIDKLVQICDEIMPKEAGLDVMHVEFSPLLESAETIDTSISEVEDVAAHLSQEIMAKILPADVKQNGKDMAGVYLYLYCVENSLRLFIETVARKKLGDQYLDKLRMSRETRDRIVQRKANEKKKKWLPTRGGSDIFYLDFKDLGSIIQNNWKLFSHYFPDLNWITTKIDEISDCRNLVAHNSFLDVHQRNLVKVYYTSILRQLNETLRDSTHNLSE
jgi:hypothetical protein